MKRRNGKKKGEEESASDGMCWEKRCREGDGLSQPLEVGLKKLAHGVKRFLWGQIVERERRVEQLTGKSGKGRLGSMKRGGKAKNPFLGKGGRGAPKPNEGHHHARLGKSMYGGIFNRAPAGKRRQPGT